MLATRPMSAEAERDSDTLRALFHRLNNQLGIVLANAELLESRLVDESTRARAAVVVDSALQAMTTVRQLRHHLEPDPGVD